METAMFAAVVALLFECIALFSHDMHLEIPMLTDLFLMSSSVVGLVFVVYARRKLAPPRVDRPPDPPVDRAPRPGEPDYRPLPGAGVVTNGFDV
jgi:hypothetical protein